MSPRGAPQEGSGLGRRLGAAEPSWERVRAGPSAAMHQDQERGGNSATGARLPEPGDGQRFRRPWERAGQASHDPSAAAPCHRGWDVRHGRRRSRSRAPAGRVPRRRSGSAPAPHPSASGPPREVSSHVRIEVLVLARCATLLNGSTARSQIGSRTRCEAPMYKAMGGHRHVPDCLAGCECNLALVSSLPTMLPANCPDPLAMRRRVVTRSQRRNRKQITVRGRSPTWD